MGTLTTMDAWEALRCKPPLVTPKKELENWLSLDTVKVVSGTALNMLGQAIMYVLEAAGIAINIAFIGAVTVLDKLSYCLEYTWKASKELASWVVYLLKKILSLAGKVATTPAKITGTFIRWVLQLLLTSVRRLVALSFHGAGI